MNKYLILQFMGLIAGLSIFVISCDTSIEPIVGEGKEYSVYGPLNISESPNYIRVHNNKALLTPEGTLPMNVEMTFTNLDNGQTQIMEDKIVEFGDLYTHNFKVEMPIEFETRYRIELNDDEGGSSDITTVTTKNAAIDALTDTAKCVSYYRVQLSGVDLNAGERLDVEVGAKVGNTWLWTTKLSSTAYDQSTNTLTYVFTPNDISIFLLGIFDWIDCSEFTSDKIRFKFTHIGYMEGNNQVTLEDTTTLSSPSPNKQVVLSKYSKEKELQIHPCEFDDNPDSCLYVN